jgi:predicted enzyme related to lactoylglutathione lyase
MSERETYPSGVPCWVDTLGTDPERLTDFYGAIFGWDFAGPGTMPGNGSPGQYHVARLRGRDVAGVGSLPTGTAPGSPGWNTYVRVENADRAAANAQAAGGTVVAEPFDAAPAGRMAVLADPEGAAFCAWEAGDREGAQLVNEPGAWSMSFLNARDTGAAATFYGELFGWRAEPFEFGELTAFLLRLPGFVGGEPQQPVPRDVVATMIPADGSTEPHWGVDFWIGDTDAAAAKAQEMGGGVIVAPHDNVAFRSAVVADPNGARFGINQLTAVP